VKKIKDVLGDIYERYPQVELYLKSNQMKGFHDLLKDSDGSSKELKELDIEQFKKALAQVDSQVKMLPATAQVFTCSFRGLLTHEFREWQDHFCNLCANVALLVGSGCRTRGKLPSRLLQQNEDV